MKNVLIPTDFSENAWLATMYALHLFKDTDCTFYFLHSTKLSVSRISTFSNKLLEVMRNDALRDLNNLLQKVEETIPNPKHKFKVLLSNHDIEQAIDISINSNKIDLVVMGTKGASNTKGSLFGSNTVGVINKVKLCPVLIIPSITEFTPPKLIGFPSDLKKNYHKELIKPIKEIAKIAGATVKVMHINTEKELSPQQHQNLDALTMFLDMDAVKNSYESIADYADKTTEIVDFIFYHNIDMLAMISYKHNFFEKLLREPVIKRLGHHVDIPFLVIPEKLNTPNHEA